MTRNWTGRIAIALGILVLLLLAAAAVLIATFDANRYKTVAIDWMKTEHQRTLAIDGPIELAFFPRLAVKVSALRLSEAGRDDEFAAVEEAALAVRVMPLLSNKLVIDRISARGVHATYARDAEGVRNIDDLVTGKAKAGEDVGEDAGASAGAMRFDVSAVQFDDLRLRVRDELADVDGEVVLLSFSSGRLANKVESPLSLRATVRLTRPQAVELALDGSMTLGLDLDERAIAMSALKLGVESTGAGVDAVSLVLEGALAWDGSTVRASSLAAHGSADADTGMVQWKLNGALDTNHFHTSGQATLGGTVPHIKASARFDSLDLNQLLAAVRPAAADTMMTTSAATEPADTPLQLNGLQALNGELALEAGALVFRHYKVADARLIATLDKGVLRVSTLSGRAWGGSFAGSGSADASTGGIAAKLDARGVDVNPLLKDVAGKDLLEGRGNVSAELASSGSTISALRSRLGGRAVLQLRDGAIKGINLARALRQAKAALSRQQDAIARAQASERTDFSELSISARIADGVAYSDDLDIKSPFLRIGGEGRFDIGRGRIDYEARATVIASSAGQGGAELEALRGVSIPVALSGPFDAIDWKIQWSSVAAAAVRQKLKDELSERLSEKLGTRLGLPAAAGDQAPAPVTPQDLLRDRLRGLLR